MGNLEAFTMTTIILLEQWYREGIFNLNIEMGVAMETRVPIGPAQSHGNIIDRRTAS
jgi:hypothetical protein